MLRYCCMMELLASVSNKYWTTLYFIFLSAWSERYWTLSIPDKTISLLPGLACYHTSLCTIGSSDWRHCAVDYIPFNESPNLPRICIVLRTKSFLIFQHFFLKYFCSWFSFPEDVLIWLKTERHDWVTLQSTIEELCRLAPCSLIPTSRYEHRL